MLHMTRPADEESVTLLVSCAPTDSNCSTPGLFPVLLLILGHTQSHFITLIQTDFLIVSMQASFMVPFRPTVSLSLLGNRDRAHSDDDACSTSSLFRGISSCWVGSVSGGGTYKPLVLRLVPTAGSFTFSISSLFLLLHLTSPA